MALYTPMHVLTILMHVICCVSDYSNADHVWVNPNSLGYDMVNLILKTVQEKTFKGGLKVC